MTPDLSVREAVLRLIRANPRQTTEALAAQAGVTRQRVHQILLKAEYEMVVYWRKKTKRSGSPARTQED